MLFRRCRHDARRYGWVVCLLLITACHKTLDNSVTRFFVVRHAERYPGFEGSLTWYGRQRAGDLMRLLEDSSIRRIYVSPFARTLQTADSLRLLQHIDTVYYTADTSAKALLSAIEAHADYGKNSLIVGDAEMIPAILQKLGVHYDASDIPDSVYNLLFEVVNDHGKVSLHTLHYGRPSMPPDTSSAPATK